MDNKMKLLILPCHAVLEYDEFKMFHKMGYDVRSHGSYIVPKKPHDDIRPPIDLEHPEFDHAIPAMIEWADVIVCQHRLDWLAEHFKLLKNKPIIYRSIGQVSYQSEQRLSYVKKELPQMKIVRYSKLESITIPETNKEDYVIYFYKDINEFPIWNKQNDNLITVGQSIYDRPRECGLSYMQAMKNICIYSTNKDNRLSYNEILSLFANGGCYFYTGTRPAPYTLGFMEAAIIGIPIISIDKHLFGKNFEVDEFITNHVNGFAHHDFKLLNKQAKEVSFNYSYAMGLSENMREFAINKFCSNEILDQWRECLKSL